MARHIKASTYFICFAPGEITISSCCSSFSAAISTCRLASTSLRFLGLAVATAFLLSTISLGGSPWPLRPLPHFLVGIRVRYSSSSICTTRRSAYYILRSTFITFIFASKITLFFTVYEYRIIYRKNGTITATAALSNT